MLIEGQTMLMLGKKPFSVDKDKYVLQHQLEELLQYALLNTFYAEYERQLHIWILVLRILVTVPLM